MHRIVAGRPADPHLPGELRDAMFRLRHQVFHERLRWQVRSRNGRERDSFDDLDPVYVIGCHTESGTVTASLRMLPTTGPYMLRDVFPQALRGAPAPCDPQTWEISRLCVTRPAHVRGSGYELTQRLLAAAAEYAAGEAVHSFVAISQVTVERMAAGAGVPSRRFGDGRSVLLGELACTAYSMPVSALSMR
ncbi:acyl-homoserine-lactone synthase [Kitasatospora atroaurantiaca]|uniref:acyl-homoserine-lactone synthase n=1 Tax=Kitasatospora atroaurantiaca TaxID=285545 RepID=A0A561F0Q0_9ACTN|nr:acyl-homoserine-lactone synthase [Kitasatospora atroaurantiaca]TWE21382.1 acyl homoserine lactone synthase [Kitasatospora atroaurantiaca]